MTILKWMLLGLAVILLFVAMIPIVVTQIENKQAKENAQQLTLSNEYNKPNNNVAVIVFSRSGNTAVLAQHLAEQENGDFYRLEAKEYKLGLKGWTKALQDARGNKADIAPQTIDLSKYNRIYLGSPIWLYSPAPPIWQFVENNKFDGKEVILFNSFNSKFEQLYIDEFEELVKSKGAISFNHRYIKRGRMGQQISTEVMIEKFDQQSLEP